jgi:hypothetical protein
MNNIRRNSLRKIISRIESTEQSFSKCLEDMENISSEIECIQDEEENCLSNTPENMEGCDRWNISENAIDCLSDAVDEFNEFLSDVDTSFIGQIKDDLHNAING